MAYFIAAYITKQRFTVLTKNGGGDHKRRLSRVHYICTMHCVQCTLEKQCTAHHVIKGPFGRIPSKWKCAFIFVSIPSYCKAISLRWSMLSGNDFWGCYPEYHAMLACLLYATHLQIRHWKIKSMCVWSSNKKLLDFKIGHHDSSPINGHQGGMHYHLSKKIRAWSMCVVDIKLAHFQHKYHWSNPEECWYDI